MPAPMVRTGHDPQVREEALKTLYRLRSKLIDQEQQPPGVLEAIESLIVKYERARDQQT